MVLHVMRLVDYYAQDLSRDFLLSLSLVPPYNPGMFPMGDLMPRLVQGFDAVKP